MLLSWRWLLRQLDSCFSENKTSSESERCQGCGTSAVFSSSVPMVVPMPPLDRMTTVHLSLLKSIHTSSHQKSPDFFLNIFATEMLITTFLQIFCESMLEYKVVFNSIIESYIGFASD